MGVWIETYVSGNITQSSPVTPFVGVWIETPIEIGADEPPICHTLRGCVD